MTASANPNQKLNLNARVGEQDMTVVNSYGGALSGGCPWYVERRQDSEVYDRLSHGENCYVLTSHQMGKSSLVVRLMDKCHKNGLNAAAIDLAAFGRELTASQWFNALTLRVGQELHLEEEFETFWVAHKSLTPFERFYRTLECVALPARPGPLILSVDEADLLRSLPFSPDEFLSAIHPAAVRRNHAGSKLNGLAFCLFATVKPDALWRERGRENPDLGHIVILDDFEHAELFDVIDGLARCLLEKHELSAVACLPAAKFALGEILERVFHWTEGHPYLTQRLASVAAHSIGSQLGNAAEITSTQCHQFVDVLSERLFTSRVAREQDCHLLWVRLNILNCGLAPAHTMELLQRVRQGVCAELLDADESETLVITGVARLREGRFQMRNRIYEHLFDDGWFSARSRTHEPSPQFLFKPGSRLFASQRGILPMATGGG